MTESVLKALSSLGVFAFLGVLIAAFWKRATDREAGMRAERQLLADHTRQEHEEQLEYIKLDAERRNELRQDLKSCRERMALLEQSKHDLDALYQARIVACRICKYPCLIHLKDHVDDPPEPLS